MDPDDDGRDRQPRRGLDTPLTATHLAIGTPMYMAPELRGAGAEPSTAGDVYALGLVVYELLVGRHPFGRPPAAALAELDPAQRAVLRRSSSEDTVALIERCLALDAGRRPSASVVAALLAGAIAR